MVHQGYYRFPTINGENVVFTSEGDLWSVPAAGGEARRLTADPAPASHPAFSPNGNRLAFTGRDEGHDEVYVMDASGGEATRLTFLGATTLVACWTPDGSRIVATTDAARPFRDLRQPQVIDPDAPGRPPVPLPTGPAMSIAMSTEGSVVIARHTSDIARWKRYRGGRTGDLWIRADGEDRWRRLIALQGNVASPLWLAGRVYFLSDHEGVANVYSVQPDGSGLRRHTHHDDFYARHPATDGRRIVYHAGADLYLLDPAAETSSRIDVVWRSPRPRRKRRFVAAADYLQGYSLHPKGGAVVVTARGRPYAMSNHDGAVVQLGAADGVRYRLAGWLADGKRVVVISDAEGEEAVEVHHVDGAEPPRRLPGLDIGRPVTMTVSPTADVVAIANHRLELLLVDLGNSEVRVVDRSTHDRVRNVSWSPEGRWLAYAFSGTPQTSHIRLCEAHSGKVHEATRPVLHDFAPAFDPAGRYLYFLGQRDFSPVYDNMHFDLGFPHGTRPYLLLLREDVGNPFDPDPSWPGSQAGPAGGNGRDDDDDGGHADAGSDEPDDSEGDDVAALLATGDKHESTDVTPDAAANDMEAPGGDVKVVDRKNADDQRKPIEIDLDGLSERVLAFPVPEGRYRQMRAADGFALFVSLPVPTGAPDENRRPGGPAGRLEIWDFDARKRETIMDNVDDVSVTPDGKQMLVRSGRRLRVAKGGRKPPDKGPARQTGWLDLGRIKVSVKPAAEWRQMLREAWRLQRDQFWTPDMAGVDWQAVYDHYRPLVERVANRDELSDLVWEMQGELGTSHAYEYGGDRRSSPGWSRGFLGADLRLDEERDAWIVQSVPSGSAWSQDEGSPLARAGIDVRAGDVLLSIDGRAVGPTYSPDEALVNKAGTAVLLGFGPREDVDGSGPRVFTVRTLRDERPLRYRSWVDANRETVHQATDGKVGYVHVPDMGPAGFAEFHRGFLAELDREALIVDVRFNGGGHVSPLVLEKLARRRLGYDVQRWGPPIPYPRESLMGPIVALTNESAGSDGDMFSHAFKLLELGPLIGTRTWGGVIGIWPRQELVDGSMTTQPEFSIWFQDVGWALENHGTEPDIHVQITPDDYVAGHDPQLARAIAEALARLEADPPRLPAFSPPPSRVVPRLPRDAGEADADGESGDAAVAPGVAPGAERP